jgi:hypothetical protein
VTKPERLSAPDSFLKHMALYKLWTLHSVISCIKFGSLEEGGLDLSVGINAVLTLTDTGQR